jgi:single-strand DNA-binding protein
MITVIGRITADAQVKTVSEGRQVVTFTIAQNERFRVKGSDEIKQVVNYFSCIAKHLQKGVLVEAAGRIGVNAWIDQNGEARASLNMHVQSIQLHSKASKMDEVTSAQDQPADSVEEMDEIPF